MATFPCGPGICPVYLDTIGQSKSHSNRSSAGQESLSSHGESLPVTCCSVAVYQVTVKLSTLKQLPLENTIPDEGGSEMQAGLCWAILLRGCCLRPPACSAGRGLFWRGQLGLPHRCGPRGSPAQLCEGCGCAQGSQRQGPKRQEAEKPGPKNKTTTEPVRGGNTDSSGRRSIKD